jgi:hypothetical protein
MLFDEKKFRKCLPAEMLAEKRFVRYFLKPKPEGGTAKIPLGNHSDHNTWSTFDDCVKQLENKDQGIGYCFLGGDIHGLDIDHCRNPLTGVICNEAMLLLSRIPSWSEYSVSGAGLHVFFKGQVRGKQLTETCLQYWNPKNSPRFFALTCDMVGEAFSTLKDIGEDFNYIFATARHVSAKIREELKAVDYAQWQALPNEREHTEVAPSEKPKTKTRKVCKDFNIKDFLSFYNIPIDNETDNQLGHCIRVGVCPIKGVPHVGHNSTTANFIFPTADGGLAFHCQSTGCVEYGISEAIASLEKGKGPYPKRIYEERKQATSRSERIRNYRLLDVSKEDKEHCLWLWDGYLQANQLIHFAGASAEGKSPVTRDLVARFTCGKPWPDGSPNTFDKRTVLMLASEDDWPTVIIPHLDTAGADFTKVKRFVSTVVEGDEAHDVATALDTDVMLLEKAIVENGDVGMIVIDPITNYLGRLSMNKEDEMRGILMPLAELAQRHNVCIVTVGHLNKSKDGTLLQRVMGAAAFIGVARQTMFFSGDPDEEDKFAHVMGFGRNTTTPALKYKTALSQMEWGGKSSAIVAVAWGGKSSVDIEEAVTNPQKNASKAEVAEAAAFIKQFLRDGAKLSSVIKQALADEGVPCANLSRAAHKAGADKRKTKGSQHSKWEWYLPAHEQDSIEFDGAL